MRMDEQESISKADFKKARVALAGQKKRIKKTLFGAGILIVLGFLIFALVAWRNSRNQNIPGETIPDQGREHIAPGHEHAYNSNPPTSGWHYAADAEWGAYREELADETLIHNLEHGGIWISYKPEISEDVRKKLEGFYEKYGRKIIITPRAKNDSDVALAAWGHLDKFSAAEYSDERIERFIKAFRNKGPEFVP